MSSTAVRSVNLGGVVPLSTVDWEGLSATVVFLRGCPLRCPHCFNRGLQGGESSAEISFILEEVRRASPFVSALVLSGGEPLVQVDAVEVLARHARGLGLEVGLETCGYHPDRLRRLLDARLLDRVFLDVKAALHDPEYAGATGLEGVAPLVLESLRCCMQSGVPLEIRTTVFRGMHSIADFREIARTIADLRADHPQSGLRFVVLQRGSPEKGAGPGEDLEPVSLECLRTAAAAMEGLVKVKIRSEKRRTSPSI